VYRDALPPPFFDKTQKLFDKLTVKPKKQRKCSSSGCHARPYGVEDFFLRTFGAREGCSNAIRHWGAFAEVLSLF
jgi:hypothetical protein